MKVNGSLTKPVDKASFITPMETSTTVSGATIKLTVMVSTSTLRVPTTVAIGKMTNSTVKELRPGPKGLDMKENMT
jgi:hypothetical protein